MTALTACGTDDRAIGAPASGSDAGASPVDFVHVSTKIVDVETGAPIVGATVCVVDHPAIPCASTDLGGNYTLALPGWTSDVDLAFTETAPGYLSVVGLVHEKTGGVVDVVNWLSLPMWPEARAATFMARAGFAYPPTGKAFVVFYGGVGRTVSMKPAPGKGPVYMDPVGTPDPTLTSTTSDAYGVFGEVEPGRIEVSNSSTGCYPEPLGTGAWPDPRPSTFAGVAVAGAMTEMMLPCM